MFKGSFTALITPFKNGEVDYGAFERLVEWQIEEGTNGLVPVGTTGESPTLSHDEHKSVVETCVRVAKKRVPVIAGAGSNSTQEAIDLTEFAKRVGADATLHSTGYYNKPTQEGLYRHFKAISEAVDLPVFIYNVPPRTVVDISVATLERCAKLKNIVGIKDATANVARVTQQRLACGPNFIQLSGEDATALGFNAHGGVGCISVTSNVAPRLCAEFQAACLAGDWAKARSINERLMPLHDILFCETNPSPVKYAASKLGLCSAEVRLPMAPASDDAKRKIDAVLAQVGLERLAKAAE
ncbi:MAG: 4-hydroxy-tetrahydrodipicolinate synthase [Hyphomicrobiales bacterium]|nr:MAG: 4-hydroxy-tetrahydrodipicolinate synthase [Hyphomicrobiales bacterium]